MDSCFSPHDICGDTPLWPFQTNKQEEEWGCSTGFVSLHFFPPHYVYTYSNTVWCRFEWPRPSFKVISARWTKLSRVVYIWEVTAKKYFHRIVTGPTERLLFSCWLHDCLSKVFTLKMEDGIKVVLYNLQAYHQSYEFPNIYVRRFMPVRTNYVWRVHDKVPVIRLSLAYSTYIKLLYNKHRQWQTKEIHLATIFLYND